MIIHAIISVQWALCGLALFHGESDSECSLRRLRGLKIQGKQNNVHIDFSVWRGPQYHSLISVMEYLSVRSKAKRMSPIATECIKHFVISWFVYGPDKWSRIWRLAWGILTQRFVGVAILRVNSGTVSLLARCVIHLSVTHFCWAYHYLLVGCLWIYPQNDMKAITLHEIWVISPKNRSDVSPEIAFLSLPSCLILYAFHKGAAMCIGRRQLGFAYGCAWPFPGPLRCLVQYFGRLRCCCWIDKHSSWNLSLWGLASQYYSCILKGYFRMPTWASTLPKAMTPPPRRGPPPLASTNRMWIRRMTGDGVGGGHRVHQSCLDCQVEPEHRTIEKGPTVTGRLPKQIYDSCMALKHLFHLL